MIVLKKLLKNKWMTLCMLTGSILIIALLAGIPIYAQGVLQRVLVKDMEKLQTTSSVYPGTIKVTTTFGTSRTEKKIDNISKNVEETLDSIEETYGLDVIDRTHVVSTSTFLAYTDIDENIYADSNGVYLAKKTGIENHVKMVYGRMYEPRTDGVIEVIMTQEALVNTKLLMGTQYTLAESRYLRLDKDPTTVIEVVGVFTLSDENDTFWSEGFSGYNRTVFADEEAFDAYAAQDPVYVIRSAQWYLLLDYYGIKLRNIEFLNDSFNTDSSRMYSTDASWVVMNALEGFAEKQEQLNFSLLVLELPVLILLAFYIFMVSQLVIDNEANEIAVLKSRGASKMHIFCIYLLEGLVISAFALVVGPPLGLFMCYCLGGANGFLEFVNRAALEVHLSGRSYLYAVIAAAFFVLMMLIPAIRASRQTILTHKQQVARASGKRPVWQRFFLDFVLIAISLYGLFSYNNQQELIRSISASSSGSTVDPLMLLISTLFILGVGLLFLRIYPYFIKLIFLIGKRFWSPTFYLSLTQVSRSHGGEQFLMLFLVFTVGVSIFSANTARTINVNQEENLTYLDGADIVIRNEWNRDLAYYNTTAPGGYKVYKEISYKDYQELDSVEQATRVWKGTCQGLFSTANFVRMTPSEGVGLMAIDSAEFAETAQMRNGLTEYHWYNYCNLLTDYSSVVLLSSEFRQFGVQVGDSLQLMLADDCMRTVIVGSFVDYWPGMNVNDTTGIGNSAGVKSNFFIITTFDVIFQDTFDIPLQPYEVWIKKAEGVSSNDVYTEIGEKGLRIDARTDLTEDTINLKNDPTLQSMNGALTLCFIISLVVCFAGFLIYWIISISKRILQFGIIRAIGMKTSSLIGMLLIEQVLISGASIIAGVFIGVLTSYYFIPIYSMTQSASSLLLPFRIISMDIDYIRLYCILAAILLVGFIVLAILIKKIKINNALKIGED